MSSKSDFIRWWTNYGEMADEEIEYPAFQAGRAFQHSVESAELATLRAQLAEAREALEPFAKYGSKCTEYEESTWEFRIKGRHFAKALKVHNKLVTTA